MKNAKTFRFFFFVFNHKMSQEFEMTGFYINGDFLEKNKIKTQ